MISRSIISSLPTPSYVVFPVLMQNAASQM